MKTFEPQQRDKMDVCGREAESGCRSGGAASGRAAWWDEEQQLSPINSPYLSLPFNAAPPDSHCLIMWRLHLLLYEFHFMKIIFSCCLLFFIFFLLLLQQSLSGQRFENFPIVRGLVSAHLCRMSSPFCFSFYCSDFVSELLSRIFFLGNEWMSLAMLFQFREIKAGGKKAKCNKKESTMPNKTTFLVSFSEFWWACVEMVQSKGKVSQSEPSLYSVEFMICFN